MSWQKAAVILQKKDAFLSFPEGFLHLDTTAPSSAPFLTCASKTHIPEPYDPPGVSPPTADGNVKRYSQSILKEKVPPLSSRHTYTPEYTWIEAVLSGMPNVPVSIVSSR